MGSDSAGERRSRPLLTLGRVDRIRVQVGYRAQPDGPAFHQFLLDLPVPDGSGADGADAPDESRILGALEPVLYAGADTPRHYSLHQHRWHTSWGASPGALEIGLLVTTGVRAGELPQARDGVTRAFRALMELTGRPQPALTSREAAILRARRSAATAYALAPEQLSLRTEEHHSAENSWTVGLRTAALDEYHVVVGLVDGYAGSVGIRHERRTEVFDSVGSE